MWDAIKLNNICKYLPYYSVSFLLIIYALPKVLQSLVIISSSLAFENIEIVVLTPVSNVMTIFDIYVKVLVGEELLAARFKETDCYGIIYERKQSIGSVFFSIYSNA